MSEIRWAVLYRIEDDPGKATRDVEVHIGISFGAMPAMLVRALGEGHLAKSPEPGYSGKLSPARINDCLFSIARTWSPRSDEVQRAR